MATKNIDFTLMVQLLQLGADVGQFLIPISAAAYAAYNGDYLEAALLALMALVQQVELLFLKHLFPRQRPHGVDMHSFPSGHTAGAFLGTGLLAARYGFTASTAFAASGSVFVGFSRYFTGHHWPTDVFAGACIGLINGAVAGTRCCFAR